MSLMKKVLALLLSLTLLSGCAELMTDGPSLTTTTVSPDGGYAGQPYAVVEDNIPDFTDAEKTTTAYERYSELDRLGRCGVAMACVGQELMPTEDRGSIGQVKPSGWQTVKYDCVDGKYLYNRCHLIGYQLTGENANEQNLITGTRYLNVTGMLPFENLVADYVKETGNHVLYRVTPQFEGNNLVATTVRMEAWSVEDEGDGVCFDVLCYNVQPGIVIDYATGNSYESGETTTTTTTTASTYKSEVYVLNISSKKIHRQHCGQATKMAAENRRETTDSLEELWNDGYECAGCCF